MRIAVCDDEQRDLEQLCELLMRYDSACMPVRFFAARELFACADRFDVVFLDIEMQAPNGYEVARELSERTRRPLIVFVTHTSAYAVQGYGIAFRYLLKPVTADALAAVLKAVEAELRANNITLLIDGTEHVLDVREILYLEVQNHTAILHLQDGMYTFRATLKDLTAQLPERYFCAPQQSYLVNMQHIRSADALSVVMVNGDRIPLSRRKRQDFQHRFHNFLGGTT
ncbi:MAG: response regulator transcription factor [Clostridia bacterium]|nr:response regulator transcription factor [Clostridia bacterium]